MNISLSKQLWAFQYQKIFRADCAVWKHIIFRTQRDPGQDLHVTYSNILQITNVELEPRRRGAYRLKGGMNSLTLLSAQRGENLPKGIYCPSKSKRQIKPHFWVFVTKERLSSNNEYSISQQCSALIWSATFISAGCKNLCAAIHIWRCFKQLEESKTRAVLPLYLGVHWNGPFHTM